VKAAATASATKDIGAETFTLARNVSTRYMAITVEALLGFVVLPYNVAHLGTSAYGLWMLTGSITAYFSVLDLGYSGALVKFVAQYRARHDYHLSDRVEAGVVLTGTEVKSLRGGEATLRQAYAEVRDGEAWLVGLHVPEYTEGNRANHDPDRPRKLLLHRREIERLASSVAEKGFTVVPTKLYFRGGRVKVELALARGKELRDKRRDIAARDARRQIERELKSLRR